MRAYKILGLTLLVTCLALLTVSISNERAERFRGSSSFAQTPMGLSAFVSLAKAVVPGKIVQRRSALLSEEDLKDAGVFLTFSPKSAVSKREASILKTFTERGGRVVIGIQSPESLRNVEHLLAALELVISPTEIPTFTNGEASVVSIQSGGSLLPAPHSYAFYSRYGVGAAEPKAFFLHKTLNQGTATVFMGVPPVANALLGREDNWRIAHEILTQTGTIVLDEYHHLFSDKTVGDLLLEPSFSLPIFGMVLVGILFFLFGRLSKRDAWERKQQPAPARSFHHFGVSLFQGLVKSSKLENQAVDQHEAFLKALFPSDAARIEDAPAPKGAWLDRGARLVQVHKSLLRERGWKI